MPGRFARRFALAALVAAAVNPVPAFAAAEDDLAAARRRANQAAAELSQAETDIALAERAVAFQQGRVAQAELQLGTTQEQLRQVAIRQYVGGTANLSLLFGLGDANEVVRAQGYSRFLAGDATDSLARFRVARSDLGGELEALRDGEKAQADALEALRRRRAAASAEVDRLASVVAAQQAAAERAARQRGVAAPAAATASSPSGPTASGSVPTGGADWLCPVAGPRAFSNDFGAPRAGGRSHQGNDILAPRGTPVVANVSGVVTQRPNSLGGLAYFLAGDDGSRYYGAHLDSFGASGRVSIGTVIGTVGDSGDARGGPPHLHFEIRLGDGRTVNPYSTLTRYC